MFGLSPLHLIVVALVILVLFGKGRISEMMGDFGKGIKSFKEGMTDETTNRTAAPTLPPSQIAPPAPPPVQAASPSEIFHAPPVPTDTTKQN